MSLLARTATAHRAQSPSSSPSTQTVTQSDCAGPPAGGDPHILLFISGVADTPGPTELMMTTTEKATPS